MKDKLFYIIGEVSEELELSIPTLRFWEKEFEDLKPHKNKRGVRYYKKEDIELLKRIKYLTRDCGFTIEGAKSQLKNKPNNNYEVVNNLKEIKEFLLSLKDSL